MSGRRSQRGFTLIEMMVVVMIIAVLSALLVSVNSTTYGASSTNVADEVVMEMNLCKMRAVSSRHWHRCQITNTTTTSGTTSSVTIYQWPTSGMTVPSGNLWQNVSGVDIGANVAFWDASTTVCVSSPCTGAPTAENTSLVFNMDFRPDGSSTGGTIYISDVQHNKLYRVVVYTATGSSYARNSW